MVTAPPSCSPQQAGLVYHFSTLVNGMPVIVDPPPLVSNWLIRSPRIPAPSRLDYQSTDWCGSEGFCCADTFKAHCVNLNIIQFWYNVTSSCFTLLVIIIFKYLKGSYKLMLIHVKEETPHVLFVTRFGVTVRYGSVFSVWKSFVSQYYATECFLIFGWY